MKKPTPTPEEKRERRRWTIDGARLLITELEPFLIEAGWYIGLTGSVLLKGESFKDLDLIFFPYDKSKNPDKETARAVLRARGLFQLASVENVHERWRKGGSSDTKHVEVWGCAGRRVDLFFLE